MKVKIVYGDESVEILDHLEFYKAKDKNVQVVTVYYPGKAHIMSSFDSYYVFEDNGIVYSGGINKQGQPYSDQPNDKTRKFIIEELIRLPIKFGKTIDYDTFTRIREKHIACNN